MFSGSRQTNVIPTTATCNLDVRLLPGEKPEEFLVEIKKVIADPTIQIENVNTFKPPNSSPVDTELFQVISKVTKVRHPEALITTKMLRATQKALYRSGIVSTGGRQSIPRRGKRRRHGTTSELRENVREGTRESLRWSVKCRMTSDSGQNKYK